MARRLNISDMSFSIEEDLSILQFLVLSFYLLISPGRFARTISFSQRVTDGNYWQWKRLQIPCKLYFTGEVNAGIN